MEHPLLSFRTRGLQPFHLPSAAGVHRHGSGLHVPALRQCDLGQGVHRQADQPVQVLWLRLVRQSGLGPGGHQGDERLPGGHQAPQGAAEEAQGLQALLEGIVGGFPPSAARLSGHTE